VNHLPPDYARVIGGAQLVLDAVFGAENYRAEIVWKRYGAHNDAKTYGHVHDTIFFYTKTSSFIFNKQHESYSDDYIKQRFRFEDDDGRRWAEQNLANPNPRPNLTYSFTAKNGTAYDPPANGWKYTADRLRILDDENRLHYPAKTGGRLRLKNYLDERLGNPVQDVWVDLSAIGGTSPERLGYPTQKPVALLERIIAASSNPGDLVLDPFCGCGTTIDAAQKLGRRWIGIDVTHLAIGLIEKRLTEGYGGAAEWDTIGVPEDLASAEKLAADDPHQFQSWITLKLGGYPWMGGKKGGDRGVDGYFYYVGEGGRTETGVISVKAGQNVNPGMVRDLSRVMARDGHRLGLFVCAVLPTKGMTEEATSHGLIETEWGRFPALQTWTLAELFSGRKPNLPPLVSPNRRAPRVETRRSHTAGAQDTLL